MSKCSLKISPANVKVKPLNVRILINKETLYQ